MAIFEALNKTLRRVPAKSWLAAGGLLVGAFWLQQHDARIRQQARLQQLGNETSAEVAAFRRQVAQDVKRANVENAKAIAELAQRRQQAEQQNRQLAAQLASLRQQAQIQAGKVATLPVSEIVARVASQLGLDAGDVAYGKSADMAQHATSVPAAKPGGSESSGTADIAKGAISAPAARDKLRITNDELQASAGASLGAGIRGQDLCDLCGPKAVTQSAQSASVSSVLEPFNPQSAQSTRGKEITNYELRITKPGGSESSGTADIAKGAISAPANGSSDAAVNATRRKQTAGILRFAQDDRRRARGNERRAQDDRRRARGNERRAQDDRRRAQDDGELGEPALSLTASGARKVEAALVALDACRAESSIQAQQVGNCQSRAELDAAAIQKLQGSVASLNRALDAKDQILTRRQSEYKAELRAARGSFLGRLARVTEHVAIGVAVGIAIGAAVK